MWFFLKIQYCYTLSEWTSLFRKEPIRPLVRDLQNSTLKLSQAVKVNSCHSTRREKMRDRNYTVTIIGVGRKVFVASTYRSYVSPRNGHHDLDKNFDIWKVDVSSDKIYGVKEITINCLFLPILYLAVGLAIFNLTL